MVTKMLSVDGANYVMMLRGTKYIGISTNSVATRDQISARRKSSSPDMPLTQQYFLDKKSTASKWNP